MNENQVVMIYDPDDCLLVYMKEILLLDCSKVLNVFVMCMRQNFYFNHITYMPVFSLDFINKCVNEDVDDSVCTQKREISKLIDGNNHHHH